MGTPVIAATRYPHVPRKRKDPAVNLKDINWLRTKERVFLEVTVGPEEARLLLTANTRNRPLKPAVVSGYSHAMEVGHWGECPEPLAFDWNGALIEGAHRLHAIIRSGTRQRFTIATGYSPDTFKHLGKGSYRSLADDIALLGIPNYKLVATLARRLAVYAKSGQMSRSIIAFGKNGSGPGATGYADSVDHLEVATKYAPIAESARFGNSFRHKGANRELVHRSVLALLHALYSPWYAGTEAFLTRVVTGLGLDEGDPAYALRARLEANIAMPVKDRMHPADLAGYGIIAANADADKRRLKRLSWPRSEGYPQPNVHIAPQIRAAVGWPEDAS